MKFAMIVTSWTSGLPLFSAVRLALPRTEFEINGGYASISGEA
jgi:hypothetical protein